ncbi:hypothetical protein AB0N61_15950 [Microbacterium sp. NPDC089320]|uniref:hypothetical protein n=1 Tax=Microbacterium sp. NPDC089320 TaxID=3155182 RepID=UPI00143C9D25
MAVGDIETFQRDGIWFNRIIGESRTLGSGFETEDEAVRVGRGAATARQVLHTVRVEEGPSGTGNLYDWHPRDLMN